MKCDTKKPCMFLLKHRMGCAKKSGFNVLKDLSGCEHHRVQDKANYDGMYYETRAKTTHRGGTIDRVAFRRLAENDHTSNEIAEILGCAQSYVHPFARKNGIKVKKMKQGGDLSKFKLRKKNEAKQAKIRQEERTA